MGTVNTNFERVGYYANIMRIRHARAVRAPSIGFEYEIPLASDGVFDTSDYNEEDWDFFEESEEMLYECPSPAWQRFANSRDVSRGEFCLNLLERLGYRSHTECGGFEIASPIFPTIATARSHANNIVRLVRSKSDLFHDCNSERMNDCGIHVHVCLPDNWRVYGQGDRRDDLFNMMAAMCNRQSSRDFIWDLSGRDEHSDFGSYYIDQGQANGWDRSGGAWRMTDYIHSEMFRLNNPCGDQGTIENRMFAAKTDRLVPAIEFTHSLLNFCVWLIKRNRCEFGVPEFPYLAQWKEWLGQQSGYRSLKSYANLDLIGG